MIDKTDEIIEILEEILRWTKFQGWRNVKEILLDTVNDESKLIYHHYSDGMSSREIAAKVSVSHQTVINYWKKWVRVGIIEPIKTHGGIRYRKIFELEDFGIEIPKIEGKGSEKHE